MKLEVKIIIIIASRISRTSVYIRGFIIKFESNFAIDYEGWS